jgi:hypothetical protein
MHFHLVVFFFFHLGCTYLCACNYDPLATVDDGSCDLSCCSNSVSEWVGVYAGSGCNPADCCCLTALWITSPNSTFLNIAANVDVCVFLLLVLFLPCLSLGCVMQWNTHSSQHHSSSTLQSSTLFRAQLRRSHQHGLSVGQNGLQCIDVPR